MVVASYEYVLPLACSWQGSRISSGPLAFTFDAPYDKEWFKRWDAALFTDHRKKLAYLARAYPPLDDGRGGLWFERGCLRSISRDGRVEFRRRSEWFRKLPTDLLYAQRITGLQKISVEIPEMWIRREELPLMALKGGHLAMELHPKQLERAQKVIDKYPLEAALLITHGSIRRYLLRYYLATGAITAEQYGRHRRKTAKQMAADPSLLRL